MSDEFDHDSSSEQDSVRVNFSKPFPLFPLTDVSLLPHAVIGLFIFERRYRQMLEHVLDTHGQIAMAVYDHDADASSADANPPIKSAVCVGQVVQHRRNADGTYNILLQGVCRASISKEFPPPNEQDSYLQLDDTGNIHDTGEPRLYRSAMLEPLDAASDIPPEQLEVIHDDVVNMLEHGAIAELEPIRKVRDHIHDRDDELSPVVFFDLMALSLFSIVDARDLRYRLLSEPDTTSRAEFIKRELLELNATIAAADQQFDPDAPKGVSWN